MPMVFDEVSGSVDESRQASLSSEREAQPPPKPPDPQSIPVYVLKAVLIRLQQRLERLMAD